MEGKDTTLFDVNVYFVLPKNVKSSNDCDGDMLHAFSKCSEWEITPEWISESKCLELSPNKKDVFILQNFEGETFEKLLNYKCILIGPRCLLTCFRKGEPIPQGLTPVFNTAMRGLIVCASGFSGAKKYEIQKKVEYMGGMFTKQLRSSVTHLVTDIVLSAKYERAIKLGINVVIFDWIQALWETNLYDSIPATNYVYDKYKCPVFLNLVVTSTNLPKKQKEEVKRIINDNGGEFMGVLDGTKIKVVITLETSSLSEKLKYAMQNNIPCLKIEWIHESIKAGYSLPFDNFLIQSTKACSTPEKTSNEPLNFSCISVISGDNPNNYIDETMASSTMSSTIMSSTIMNSTGLLVRVSTMNKNTYTSVVDKLNVADAKKAGPFLDGCNIYLTGFSSNERDKLNRILTVGCATRLDEVSDALTHVIIGDPLKATQDLKEIKSKGLQPCILKIDWLAECIKHKAPALEDNFIFDCKESKQNPVEVPSPLSKKNLQLLKRPKIPPAPKFESPKVIERPAIDDHSEIIEQYLHKDNSEQIPIKNRSAAKQWNDLTRREKSTLTEDQRDLSAIPISQESFVTQKLFRGLVFAVGEFNELETSQLLSSIHGLGGKIVGNNYVGKPDFGVVSKLGGKLKLSVKEVVSELFIEDCIDNEKLVDINYYHRPINFKKNVQPLKNCVIGMSTYSGVERNYLSALAEALGAKYQDTFARKTSVEKKTFSSTHLVCPKPEGQKYSAAVKWKLPAVTAEWLIECSAKMKLVGETPYLVGETIAPEREDTIMTDNSGFEKDEISPLSRELAGPTTSKRKNIDEELPEGATPIIHKRLNMLIGGEKTPQNEKSPFHVNTPESPYGQIFKENPSPRTKKAWYKWIDSFPDLKVEEPPSKRRRSTPLSEVKRKTWEAVVMGRSINDKNETKNSDSINGTNKVEHDERNDLESSHVVNRKLSFIDENSPPKTPLNPAINLQIAQLDEILSRASSTPERLLSSADHSNPYRLEPSGSCLVKESQPESIGWEDPGKRVTPSFQSVINKSLDFKSEEYEDESPAYSIKKNKPKFMLSGIKEKDEAEACIKKLGGEISHQSAFDKTATHLLCLKPSRNEKILSSIASGKWVLHFSYLKACEIEKKFVEEDKFELGNPKSDGIIPSASNENERIIMNAAYRWRLNLLRNPGGAFCNIVALLITQKEKRDQFERLIDAGGGVVVEAKPPYKDSPLGNKITHCFVQPKSIDHQVDWAMMASKGIMCFPPQYLNDHLMAEIPLNPKKCVLPEFVKYLALMPK